MTSKVIKMSEARSRLDPETKQKMHAFLKNELTWAEGEGMTYEEAQRIAEIGCELAAKGRLQDALVIFEGLVAGNPKDTAAQAALGTIYQRLNRREEAMACYDKAIELFESNVVALAHRGELRLHRNDPGGIEDLAKAVKVDESCASAAGTRARNILTALASKASDVSSARQ